MKKNKFEDTEKAVNRADLEAVESQYGFTFPKAIRDHYLRQNGGSPERYLYKAHDEVYVISEFLAVKHGENLLEHSFQHLKIDEAILPAHLVPFAVDPGGDYYCFSIRDEDQGSIWIYRGEYSDEPERAIDYLARSLPEFITAMNEDED